MSLIGWVDRLLAPEPADRPAQLRAGLAVVALLSAALGVALWPTAFASGDTAALDTRQHVYWMRRFLEPGLFPGDPHTDYFQTVAPLGYAALYWLLAVAGVDPLVASKLLPVAIGVATSVLAFRLATILWEQPLAAFLAAVLLTQYVWMHPDIVSATPRAFTYPVFLAFMWALAACHGPGLVAAVVATAGLYPPFLLLEIVVIVGWLFARSPTRRSMAWSGLALGVALAGLLIFARRTAVYGPVVTLAVARGMDEFSARGTRPLFVDSPMYYWWTSYETGINQYFTHQGAAPALLAALALPLLVWWPARGRPPLPQVGWRLLLVVLGASIATFLAAHATMFWLYNPGRYTAHTTGIVAAMAAGGAWVELARRSWTWAGVAPRGPRASATAAAILTTFVAIIAATPWLPGLPARHAYERGSSPALYRYLADTPVDALTATLTNESDHIPMFARRKVLVASTMNPYHLTFYLPLQRALLALIDAQYARRPAEVAAFCREYGVSYLIIDRDAFEPDYVDRNAWLRQCGREAAGIRARMSGGERFALQDPPPAWIAFESSELVVLRASAIAAAPAAP